MTQAHWFAMPFVEAGRPAKGYAASYLLDGEASGGMRAINFTNQGTAVMLRTAHVLADKSGSTVANQLPSFFVHPLDPNVLFILFALAAVCIFLELSHPGAIVPGVVGAIALTIFLFGAVSLDPNWSGLVLMILAVILLAIDVRLPTHGVLTLGGLVSLVIGSLIFFDTGAGQHVSSINIYMVLGVALGMGLVALAVIRYAVMSRHGPQISGTEGLLGQTGLVTVSLKPEGRVKVLGEDWAAELSPEVAIFDLTIEASRKVRITACEGLKLIVEPVEPVQGDILGLLLRRLAPKPNVKLVDSSQGPIVESDRPIQE